MRATTISTASLSGRMNQSPCNRRFKSALIGGVVGSLLAGGALLVVFYIHFRPAFQAGTAQAVRQSAPSQTGNAWQFTNLEAAASAVIPAVVSVKGIGAPQVGNSNGSGVLIDPRGYIATNQHVVAGSERILITIHDRQELWAEVIAADTATDLALLRVATQTELPAIEFGDSDSLRVGQWLLAVGNPFGLRSTVTAGILSARGRRIDAYGHGDRIESFLQTDAAVNPGSSGGALVDAAGKLVGINTAILSESGRHEGFNFAIPAKLAERVLNDLRDFGEVRRAKLGAYLQTVNAAQARRAGLDYARGALISELVSGGAARRAGLRRRDILLRIDGLPVASAQQLQEVLSQYRPGDQVDLTVLRSKTEHRITVRLGGKRPGKLLRRVADRQPPAVSAATPASVR